MQGPDCTCTAGHTWTHGRGIHGPMSLHVTLPLARSLKNIIKNYTFDTRLLPFQRVIFSDRILYALGKAKEKLFCGSCLSTVLCSQSKKSLEKNTASLI